MGNVMFDYRSLGKRLAVPAKIVQKIEKEVRNEFPFDPMLREIHIFRAVKTYAKTAVHDVH